MKCVSGQLFLLPLQFVTREGWYARMPKGVVVFAVVSVLLVLATAPRDARATDRTNIPLKNWGGFAVYRDAVYDDLERLVTAGLADRAIVNTKPLSRTEGARLVARAIEKIRTDDAVVYNNRRDLEAVLDRLTDEFRPELAALGVKLPADQTAAPGFFSFTPIDRAQIRGGYASRDFSKGSRTCRGASRVSKRSVNSSAIPQRETLSRYSTRSSRTTGASPVNAGNHR